MIRLKGIGHINLRVADEAASKQFYRDVLGFFVTEEDPEHGGVFMSLGDNFHTLDIGQHPNPEAAAEAAARPYSGSCTSPSRSTAIRRCATPISIS